MEEVVSMIKSCVVINKGGLLLEDLNSSYKELVGDSIPYKKFKFASLEEFIYTIPEICVSDSTNGLILTIRDPKLAHISNLVSKQKSDVKKKKSAGHLQQKNLVSYKIRPKVSPVASKVSNSAIKEVKSMIKSCIVSHKGGLYLEDLDRNYRELVGEPIPYKKFNYDTLEELVYSIPEISISGSWQGQILTINDPKLAHISNLVGKQKTSINIKKQPKKTASKSVTYPSYSKVVAPYSVSHIVQPKQVSDSLASQQVKPKVASPLTTINKEAPHYINADASEILDEEMDYTISVMKSLLVINSGKLYLEDLYHNYRDLVGSFIPYRRFNYGSLEEFVSSISGIHISQDKCGLVLTLDDPKYSPVVGQPTEKPKWNANDKKQPKSISRISAPQNVQPELTPAHLKIQEKYDTISLIKACLKLNEGGLMMDDLESYYEELVGEFIPYQKFEYDSLLEFLCDIPEIFINQRRNGYFLILEDPNTTRKPQKDIYASTRASLPNTSYSEHSTYDRCLLRNSFGPESDIRDLMYKNGMLKVTINNDLCEERSGEAIFQPTDYHIPSGGRKSEDRSRGRINSSPISRKQKNEEIHPSRTSPIPRRIRRSQTVNKQNLLVEIKNDTLTKPVGKLCPRYDDGLNDEDISCSTS